MIKEALFPQPWIEEQDDPQTEINECITKSITDYPKEIQERLKAGTGSRMGQFRSFKLGNKVVEK
jgi:hypothetical protein